MIGKNLRRRKSCKGKLQFVLTAETSSNECNTLQRTAGRRLYWKWYSPS